jgi:hypothetical protein
LPKVLCWVVVIFTIESTKILDSRLMSDRYRSQCSPAKPSTDITSTLKSHDSLMSNYRPNLEDLPADVQKSRVMIHDTNSTIDITGRFLLAWFVHLCLFHLNDEKNVKQPRELREEQHNAFDDLKPSGLRVYSDYSIWVGEIVVHALEKKHSTWDRLYKENQRVQDADIMNLVIKIVDPFEFHIYMV